MGLHLADRVRETTTTTGTGNITLAGTVSGFRTFSSAIAIGDRFPYGIVSGTTWETGVGTLLTSTTFSRDLSDSSTGNLLNLSGTSDVVLTQTAMSIATIDAVHFGVQMRMYP
jgi:hypothetical protein